MYVLLKKRSKGQNNILYDTSWLRKEVKEVNRYIFAYISLKKHWKCIQETNNLPKGRCEIGQTEAEL